MSLVFPLRSFVTSFHVFLICLLGTLLLTLRVLHLQDLVFSSIFTKLLKHHNLLSCKLCLMPLNFSLVLYIAKPSVLMHAEHNLHRVQKGKPLGNKGTKCLNLLYPLPTLVLILSTAPLLALILSPR